MLMLLPVAFVSVVFLSSYPVENWGISAERALILAKVLAVAFLVITMLLIRFDKLSVIREKESFDFAMKEYEMLRSKWIDTEAKRMDSESQEMFSESASKGKVSANIISSGDIIVATPEEVGMTSDSAADVSEDD
jgi:predicted RND superfamily exporter protein